MDENDYMSGREAKKEAHERSERAYSHHRCHNHNEESKRLSHTLRGGVGSPWNSVYSKIRHEIPDTKFYRVSHNLDWDVAKETRIINGKIYYRDSQYQNAWQLSHYKAEVIEGAWLPIGYTSADYYIHPTKFTLERVVKAPKKKQDHRNPNRKDVEKYKTLYRQDGIWYVKWVNPEDHAKADEISEHKSKEKYPRTYGQTKSRWLQKWMIHDWFEHGLSYQVEIPVVVDYSKAKEIPRQAILGRFWSNRLAKYRTISVKIHSKQLNGEELAKYGLTNQPILTISKRKLKRSLYKT